MKKFFISLLIVVALAIVCAFAAVCFSGCTQIQGDNTGAQALGENNAATFSGNVGNTAIVPAIDYKHGVYYIPANKATFGNSLSMFIAENPELEVVAIAPDDTQTAHGVTQGYWLYARHK